MPIVTVQWWPDNKSEEIKQQVADEINETIVNAVNEAHGTDRASSEKVWVVFDEIERENWSYGAELGHHPSAEELVAQRDEE